MEWTKVIAELKRLGLTQDQIGQLCSCRQTTISALATGETTDPRYSLGVKLRRLLRRQRLLARKRGDAANTDYRKAA